MKRIAFLLTAFLLYTSVSAWAGFTFSGYEEQQKEEDATVAATIPDPDALDCPQGIQAQKIALVIAEERSAETWGSRQEQYRSFYQEINKRLQDLGLRTYTPEEIESQIAEKEIQSLIQGDTAAALNASKQLGASYFIKGIISSRTRLNPVVGIQEVFVSMDFSLNDAGGRIISRSGMDSTAFSGEDTMTAALQLVRTDADRVVAELYRDFCRWFSEHHPEHPVAEAQASLEKAGEKGASDRQTRTNPSKAEPADQKEAGSVQTVIVSAEGLADPSSETYKGDQGLMIDALRRDARRQAIEKAVGTFVDSSTLVENFTVINDRVLTKSSGLIKRIIKQTSPWKGKDGLMHMLIKAEVFITDVKEAVDELSADQRLHLIKERGDPTISVSVLVRDAARDSSTPAEQSTVAENILKERFKDFGFRVWSEDYSRRLRGEDAGNRREADFSVIGEAKFSRRDYTLPGSGTSLTRHVLTSWAVKCINNHTGEEIYFNNQIPTSETWDNEDKALQDIGRLIGREFNRDFFSTYLNRPSTIFRMEIRGLPDYDTALLIKKDMIGLRPILNVDIRDFRSSGLSIFEVEFAGSRSNFSQIVNNAVLKPINAKLGGMNLQLTARHGNVIGITFSSNLDSATIKDRLESMPPASLAQAAPGRIESLVNSKDLKEKIKELNPDFGNRGGKVPERGTSAVIQDF